MKRTKLGLLLAVLVLLGTLAPWAWAAETVDPAQRGELIIEYVYDSKPVTGAMFCLYRVADVDANGMYTLCGAFADYPVVLNDRSDSNWRKVASTLNAFAKRDLLNPDYVATVSEYGFAVITDLEPGLYLLGASRFVGNDGLYISQPAMAPIPAKQNPDSQWYYSVSVLPKCTFEPHGDMGVSARKVLKVWDDKGSEMYRPEKLEIQLLCNGVVYDTVFLSEENGWSYVWRDLSAGDEWIAVEVVPEGYTVEIDSDGLITTITNTNHTPPPPTKPENNSPQTGMLWWPLPLLLAAGIGFIVLGVKLRRYDA
jgi:hypothetical protein